MNQEINNLETIEPTSDDSSNNWMSKVNPEQALQAATDLAGMYKECVLMHERTKQVEAWSSAKIAETVAKFKTAQDFMEKSFGERDKSLSKYYEVLDQAVSSGDREMIIGAMHNISGIVTKSPLDDFEKFVALYNDHSQPLLDF